MPAEQFNIYCLRQRIGLPTVGEVRAKIINSGAVIVEGPQNGLPIVFLVAALPEKAAALKAELNKLEWTVEPKRPPATPPPLKKLPVSEDQSNVIRFPLHRVVR